MNMALRHFYDHYGVAAPNDPISKASFKNPLSVPTHLEGRALEKSWGFNGKTLREPLTTRVVKDRVSATISHLPAKVIAKAAGSSIKAAENARQGLNTMSLTRFLNTCRDIPELRALAIELMGCQVECDPEFERGLSMLVNAVARRNNT